MTAYYNEIDPFAAAWLKELIKAGHIAPGEVDTRSIEDVRADDLRGFTQCHFFAGIGVWSYALRCAGWPDDRPVWTGSCPCQPFSAAGKRGGTADERHLWPALFHLISICRPGTLFGEQVASKDGLSWLDTVSSDMEGQGYAFAAVDIPACGFGAPHIRSRLYFVGESREFTERRAFSGSSRRGQSNVKDNGETHEGIGSELRGPARLLADTEHDGQHRQGGFEAEQIRDEQDEWLPVGNCEPRLLADAEISGSGTGLCDCRPGAERGLQLADRGELGDTDSPGTSRLGENGGQGEAQGRLRCGPCNGFWSDAVWLPCRDGKARPVGVEFMDNPSGPRCDGEGQGPEGEARDEARLRGPECGCSPDRGELGDTDSPGPSRLGEDGGQGEAQGRLRCGPCNGFWRDAIWLPCRDGKARPVEPCVEPMADGIAGDLGLVRLESYPDHPHKERIIYAPLIQKGKARVGRLRGYGNAIVCPVATEFIRAYMESKC